MTTVTVAGLSTSAIMDACDMAGAGGTVYFPQTVTPYVSDDLKVLHDDQTWVLDRRAMIKRSDTSATPIVKVEAQGLRIRGGIFDGSRDTNTTLMTGISGAGVDFDFQDFTLQNVNSWGVAFDETSGIVRDATIKNTKHAGIILRNLTSTTRQGPIVERVLVDRRTENPVTMTAGGIILNGAPGKWFISPRIVDCRILLPATSTDHAVCSEITYSQEPLMLRNYAAGGRIGHSFGVVERGVQESNIGKFQFDYANEIAQNSIDCNARFNGGSGYGRPGNAVTPVGCIVSNSNCNVFYSSFGAGFGTKVQYLNSTGSNNWN